MFKRLMRHGSRQHFAAQRTSGQAFALSFTVRYGLGMLAVTVLSACANIGSLKNSKSSGSTTVLQAFLHCDAQFFDVLTRQGASIEALKPALKTSAGISRIAVPDRRSDEGQALALKPAFTVNGVAFNEFIDEITQFESKSETAYYWGFNTDAPLNQVLPMVRALLPPARALSVDGKTWARIDVFEQGVWRAVPEHALLKGKPALLPERALIVETHEGGGTRVVCGLQAAPLAAAVLLRLRPDLE